MVNGEDEKNLFEFEFFNLLISLHAWSNENDNKSYMNIIYATIYTYIQNNNMSRSSDISLYNIIIVQNNYVYILFNQNKDTCREADA